LFSARDVWACVWCARPPLQPVPNRPLSHCTETVEPIDPYGTSHTESCTITTDRPNVSSPESIGVFYRHSGRKWDISLFWFSVLCWTIFAYFNRFTLLAHVLSKGCHLDVVRGPSTPHDPESDAVGSLCSWQGHPSR
jgi:hypothetical protein